MNKRDEDKFTSFLAVVIVFGLFFLIGAICQATEEKECAKYGCDNTVSGSGSYCYVHDNYWNYPSYNGSYGSSFGSSGKSSSGTSTAGASASGSTKKSTSGSSSKKSSSTSSKKSSSSSSWKSYDEGYDAVYEDDDYDWDRYWSDSDYADGVDDAMEDLDW